jgi:hypothetical protein
VAGYPGAMPVNADETTCKSDFKCEACRSEGLFCR